MNSYLKYIIPVTLLGVCVLVVWMCGGVASTRPSFTVRGNCENGTHLPESKLVMNPARTPTTLQRFHPAERAQGVLPKQLGGVVTLFDAIRWEESRNVINPPPGDDGKSLGPYQCGRAAWTDSGVTLDYDVHVWHRECTEKVMGAYWQSYNCFTDESKSRGWNGGPRGMYKQSTKAYWAKVETLLKG